MRFTIYKTGQWGIAVIFLLAGITKLLSPLNFATIIEAYGLIPEFLIFPVAVLLPLIEVIAAIGLLFNVRGSLMSILMLLILFILILGYGIYMGLSVDCGCFLPEDPEGNAYASLKPALYRDIVMLLAVMFLYVARYKLKIDPIRIGSLIKTNRIIGDENV